MSIKQSKRITAVKAEARTLSRELGEIVDEAAALAKLLNRLRGMPKGPWKSRVDEQIREWFQGNGSRERTEKQVPDGHVTIRYETLREVYFWDGGNPENQYVQVLSKGLDADTLERLIQDGDPPLDSVPDDDDIPF